MFFPPHPTSSNLLTGKNATNAPRATLASRGHIDLFGAGLVGAQGAEGVIKKLETRKTVTKLSLSHNELGDEGCVRLFAYLRTAGSSRDQIAELRLISNVIGETGLMAICAWLHGNDTVREIYLGHNEFYLSQTSILTLAEAINSSKLQFLSLNTNPSFGDTFISTFLPALHTPHLRELQLSDIGLTTRASRPLADFVRDRQRSGKLHVLKLNANSLGYRGVSRIVRAAQHNWALTRLELAANHLMDSDSEPELSGSSAEAKTGTKTPPTKGDWRTFEADLHRLVLRNTHAKRMVENDALRLLRYARPILLTPVDITSSLHARLPLELVMHVLSFLAPSLSTAQSLRVCIYAQDRRTLPLVGVSALRLPGAPLPRLDNDCIPDPASLNFAVGGVSSPSPSPLAASVSPPSGLVAPKAPLWAVTPAPGAEARAATHRCANGCMGVGNSLRCSREELRVQWLEEIGCDAYEPED